MVKLRAREWILLTGLADLKPGVLPRRVRGTHVVSIKSRIRTHVSGARAAVTQMDGDALRRLTGENPRGAAEVAATVLQLNHVTKDRAMLAAGGSDPINEA